MYSMKNKKKSTIKCIHSIEFEPTSSGFVIYYHGNGFLQHMVRILTGTLLEVGLGHLEPDAIPQILEARTRAIAGPTAPSHALFLEEAISLFFFFALEEEIYGSPSCIH